MDNASYFPTCELQYDPYGTVVFGLSASNPCESGSTFADLLDQNSRRDGSSGTYQTGVPHLRSEQEQLPVPGPFPDRHVGPGSVAASRPANRERPDPYWRVSSPEGGNSGIIPGGPNDLPFDWLNVGSGQ